MIDLIDGIFFHRNLLLIQRAGHQSIASRDIDDQRSLRFD